MRYIADPTHTGARASRRQTDNTRAPKSAPVNARGQRAAVAHAAPVEPRRAEAVGGRVRVVRVVVDSRGRARVLRDAAPLEVRAPLGQALASDVGHVDLTVAAVGPALEPRDLRALRVALVHDVAVARWAAEARGEGAARQRLRGHSARLRVLV